ncbi:MAG: sodium-dependent transporter [Desulfovibrionaceae bacterium]|nr:sodium-dependent transporter [Desulfovibrionaceae bacterium]
MARERLASRLGFLLLSAGCAIGLGNVWRFPWITGQYGGAWFVLIYLGFLVAVGLPILVMEFSLGRASRRNMGRSFHMLEPAGTKWHRIGWFSLVGSYLLMMLYIPVAGWMLAYCWYMASGQLNLPPAEVGAFFGSMLADPVSMTVWAAVVLAVSLVVCWFGVRHGLERVTKVMMSGLLLIMVVLAVRALTLDGASEGLAFYLAPDLERLKQAGILNAVTAAMNQSFFTLGLGIGSMLIFGSYLDNRRSLTGESVWIVTLDTFVALTSGLIIFPACFAYGVQPDSGPGLILITLPNIFNQMPMGTLWGCLFFVFMSCAALTTVIAVVENIVSYSMDVHGWDRRKSIRVHGLGLAILMMPCILGFNVWKDFTPFGPGSCVLDLEDFLLSYNMLPVGVTVIILFCTTRYGWGWNNFLNETDKGVGPNFPRWPRVYLTYVLPVIILCLFVQGYVQKFF